MFFSSLLKVSMFLMVNVLAGRCSDPSPENGFVGSWSDPPENGKYRNMAGVRVDCNDEYVLDIYVSGDHQIRCEKGRWYPPPAKCTPIDEGEWIRIKMYIFQFFQKLLLFSVLSTQIWLYYVMVMASG